MKSSELNKHLYLKMDLKVAVKWLWIYGALIFSCATYCRPLHAQNENRIRQAVTSLEIVVGGDDGLTQGLVEAIRAEVAENRDLAITGDVANSAIRLEIPTNVDWQKGPDGLVIHYAVIFLDGDSRYLGGSFGGCLESELSKCAKRIISDLRPVLKERRPAALSSGTV